MKNQLILFSLILLLVSCSKDSESDESKPEKLIIGEWLFISENDYRCGTDDEVVTERLGTDNEAPHYDRYNEDGTWERRNGTEPYEPGGTWENLGNYQFEIYFSPDDVTDIITIEFDGNNVMNYNIDRQCIELANGENIHSYTVWNRQ